MPYQFLSEEWVEQARAIRDEYRDRTPVMSVPPLRVNLVITDSPFDGGEVKAHSDTHGGDIAIELGHVAEPDLTIRTDYETARNLLLEQKPAAGIQAFLLGKLRVEGDLAAVLEDPDQLAALLSGFATVSGLSDIDPLAAEVGERLKAMTA